MESNLLIIFLLVDIAGFFAAWILTRRHENIIQLRGIAYCFTLFAIFDYSHLAFHEMLSGEVLMLLELGVSSSWLIVRTVVAALCIDAVFHSHKEQHLEH